MEGLKFHPYALHVALGTYSINEETNYIKGIREKYEYFRNELFKNGEYEDEAKSGFPFYQPYIFHLFGHYDVAFISLIDSYKFAQSVFDKPLKLTSDNESTEINNNTNYQVQTGTILIQNIIEDNKNIEFSKEFSNKLKSLIISSSFIQISNLKLNNGLLIGNGFLFQKKVIEKLNFLFRNYSDKNIHYILLDSYNWADMTLLLFCNDPEILPDVLSTIRELNISNLELDNYIIRNSLYSQKFGYNEEEIQNSHVFVDTHSYLGVSEKICSIDNKTNLSTITEWSIKPGHFNNFFCKAKDAGFITKNINSKCGKSDYYTIKDVELSSISQIFEKQKTLINEIRKVSTHPIFETKQSIIETKASGILDLNLKLCSIKFGRKQLRNIEENLKKIKLSRQLRVKVLKVFHNYNNGINTISYVYFIDFFPLLRFLENRIEILANKVDKAIKANFSDFSFENFEIKLIEKELDNISQTFEDSYFDRILNNSNYEDINDFNTDFNASITQIISIYDSIIKLLSPSFFEIHKKLLVRQNETNTVSNIISINYNVYHLLEPPLVFNTVVKEILNNFFTNLRNYAESPKNKNKYNITIPINIILEKRKEIELQNLQIGELARDLDEIDTKRYITDFDFDYFYIDIIKYFHTFNGNTELYIFWSWVYFLQNTSQYTTLGAIEESSFIKELFKICLIVTAFDKSNLNKLEYPIPELFSYWEKHFNNIKKISANLIKQDVFKLIIKNILEIYGNYIVTGEGKYEYDYTRKIYHDIYKFYIDKFKTILIKPTNICNKYRKFNNKVTRNLIAYSEILEMCSNLFKNELAEGKSIILNSNSSPVSNNYLNNLYPDYFYNALSYTTLNWYFEKCEKQINVLRRDYEKGEPFTEFINNKKEAFLFIDPHGDFFMVNQISRSESMKFKHAVIHSLWHLGMVNKIDLF